MSETESNKTEYCNNSTTQNKTREKMIYGVGQFGIALFSSLMGSSLVNYYDDYIGITNLDIIGNAFIIYTVWNFLNDPLFGTISDKTKHPLGKRIPYIRYGTIPLVICFLFMWFPPSFPSDTGYFWFILVAILIFDTFYTIVGVSFYSLLPQLTLDESERASYSKFAMLFSLAGIILSYIIPIASSNRGEFLFILSIISLGGCIGLLLVSYKLKETVQEPKEETIGFRESIQTCFQNRSFLIYVAVMFSLTFFRYIITGGVVYLFKIFMKASPDHFTSVILLFIPIIVGAIVYILKLNIKLGLYNTFFIGLILILVGMMGFFLYPIQALPLDFITTFILFSFFGLSLLGFIIYMMYENTLLGRIVDEDELKTNNRREGIFFGMKNFVTKPANSLGVFYLTKLLNFYQISTDITSVSNFLHMKSLLFGWPIFLILCALIIFWRFPLKGQYLQEIKQAITDKQTKHQSKLE